MNPYLRISVRNLSQEKSHWESKSRVLKNYLASDVHQYVLTLFLWLASEILRVFSCSCGLLFKKRRKKEIHKIYLPPGSLFILKEMFHAFAKGVYVGLYFLLLFFPLLSQFHLCFPSRICEKYFQYISLNGFLVLILLPRHLLLTVSETGYWAGWTLV